ncbi:neuraminidase-like domain-containing protein [Mixta intestinalis]|uniref:Uncharacterized protein n=1 Tax=Mixta intestinalis TaxID=1615494 RepID=A0A6P1Q3Q7_9GAMM|nr:neuraminidase-like domain-containing protein [Mixta intestinalis]QHM72687.1 hypothetical protein C7M51_03005 [Mixta intestinalis]
MSISLFNQNLKEARRDALVSHYLATHDFSSLPEGSSVTTADDLYEYLLLDTKISNAVTTSRLAEAISSLQLFIHRSLEGYEGKLADTATPYLAQDAFLNNWDQYNKRYSTWAGKEKLRFYAGNYVEPSLRIGKTELFEKLENTLNQGKLTSIAAKNSLVSFVADMDDFAYMKFLCATPGNKDNVLFITGFLNEKYYGRKVLLDTSIHNDDCKPILWEGWQSLPPNIKDPIKNVVVLNYKSNNLQCSWSSYDKLINDGSGLGYLIRNYTWVLKRNGNWQLTHTEVENTFINSHSYEASCNNIDEKTYNMFFSHQGGEGNKYHLKGVLSYDIKARELVIKNVEQLSENTKLQLVVELDGEAISDRINPGNTFSQLIPLDKGETLTIAAYDSYNRYASRLDFKLKIDSNFSSPYSFSEKDTSNNVWLVDANNQQKYFTVDTASLFGQLSENLEANTENLLTYENQKLIADNGLWYYNGDKNVVGGGAFSGPYSQYLWELFFHAPYLIATRFATEQRFEEAERWYKYIFNSAGYRDEDGHILTDENGQPRYWNCYPLQQDVAWDSLTDMPASTDPDVIATADPMHYKLAIFQHTLDLLIARGDAAYRLLERDTLTEAKMYYIQAQQLLGPRPDIRMTNTWDNPTLSAEADVIQDPVTRSGEGVPLTFAQWLRAGDANEMGDGDFLPPYNDVLLAYWDKLDIRLYNLRHNLSLDGQPLSLPLFAAPVDPAELHRQQSGGNGIQGDVSPADRADTGWRYPLLAVKAQEAVSRLREFGSGLLAALEKQDSEKVTMLLQSQQSSVLGLQQEIAQNNLDSLNAELAALNSSREGLVLNQKYYTSLINGDLSAAEVAGLALRGGSMVGNTAAAIALFPAGVMRAIPNIFGLANGGHDLGAPVEAAAQGLQVSAQVLDQAAAISEITASYRRRAEDWRQQSELAAKSIEETDNRIDSLKAQIAMQQKQIALAEMEYANQQAYLDLYNSCFTGLTLYSWMVSRLSSLYYQLYDATIPVCIQAREALKREFGSSKTDSIFSTPVWNDLYQGLLAGEGLTTELQKLENVWIQNSANGLEATRTVSLAAVRGEESGSLSAAIADVLNKGTDKSAVGKLTLENNIFSAVLDMSTLQLADDYGPTSSNKTLFTKSIAVTLPTLLGPYQDIAATLSDDKGTVATLSHGIQDTGRFVVNFDDSRFLPFEGRDPRTMTLTLSIFNVKDAGDAAPNQRSIVENLSDIIFHIRYIMRNR